MTSDGDLSARELVGRLGDQLSRLMSDEIALAKAEMFASARQAILGGGLLGAAAVAGFTAWLAVVAAVIAGLGRTLPIWASALIVAASLIVAAGVLALLGLRRLRRASPTLPMTIDSVNKDIDALAGAAGAASRTVSTTAGSAGSVPAASRASLKPGARR